MPDRIRIQRGDLLEDPGCLGVVFELVSCCGDREATAACWSGAYGFAPMESVHQWCLYELQRLLRWLLYVQRVAASGSSGCVLAIS